MTAANPIAYYSVSEYHGVLGRTDRGCNIQASVKVTGVERLKEKQMKTIVGFLLVCGYGKSLCFALLLLAYDYLREVKGSIVVCISPLTALMMEQKTKYTHQGLVLEFSGELQHDIQSISNVGERIVQLIYVSPESEICSGEICSCALYTRKNYS